MVFFFANARGEWLVGKFPALHAFGGPIFIATGLFMVATAIALVGVLAADPHPADHAARLGRRGASSSAG